ncbi:hypothetical protein [Lapidilactobacillus wuchangensis]|uniref:hypothetical protein n=1 Tax=Lapidilactobacillus wuchangensis TaxID=2486001 RepID=UPI000F77C7EE|nr:hypothetical protein [Lapidilactobacillus wuchangensis]
MIRFELTRFLKNKTNWLLALLLVTLTFYNYQKIQNDTFSWEQQQYQQLLADERESAEDLKSVKAAQGAYHNTKKVIRLLEQVETTMAAGNTPQNVPRINRALYHYERFNLKMMTAGQLSSRPRIDQEVLVKELAYKVNQQITLYSTNSKQVPMINYLTNLFAENVPVIIFILVLIILNAPIFISDHDPAATNFLNLVPEAPFKKIVTKVAAFSLLSVLMLILSLLPISLFLGFKNGFGDLAYPLAGTKDSVTSTLVTSATFLKWTLLILLAVSLLIISANYLISAFTRSYVVSLSLNLVLFVGLSQLQMSANPWAKWLPWSYFDLPKVIVGRNSLSLGVNPVALQPATGCLVLLGWALFCFMLGFIAKKFFRIRH